MEKGLLEKTCKPLKHWVSVVKKSKIEKHSDILQFLKSEHDFTHGYANFVALKARKADAGSIDNNELLNAQYSKEKEVLKPLYDLLIKKIIKIGEGIEIVPKKANVSIKTKKQFALIQPSTKTRIDIGLKLRNTPIKGRLLNSGSFGSMCSHKVEITSPKEIDKELIALLTEAYKQSL